MKKIFMNISVAATLGVAVVLTACNNAEEVKKQVEEQNAAIQTLVDEKLNGLADQVNTECAAKIDSLANAAYATWQEEEAKLAKGKKPVAKKPAPKPVTPKAEPPKDPQKQRAGDAAKPVESQKQRNTDPGKTDVENQKKRN